MPLIIACRVPVMNTCCNIFLLIGIVWCITASQGQINENAVCQKLNKPNVLWTCKRIPDCQFSKPIINSKQEVRCGIDRNVLKICCPQNVAPTPSTKPTTTQKSTQTSALPPTTTKKSSAKDPTRIAWEKCQEYGRARYVNISIGGLVLGQQETFREQLDCIAETQLLITRGTRVKEKEFPHMALIGYRENQDKILWSCGGSLISEKFILSAAHCSNAGVEGDAKWALLGKLTKDTPTSNGKRPNVFRIINRYVHPGYKPPQIDNDIALFELQHPITFSTAIRPICLFTSNSIPAILKNQTYVTGWGRTAADEDLSDFLLKAVINFQADDDCKAAYRSDSNLRNGFDSKTMICAGDKYTGKDTCSGDSGGPLQFHISEFMCMWSQAGVTSYGPTFCGSKKRPTPAVYTKVANYIDWIQQIVWP